MITAAPERPAVLRLEAANIPAELRERAQWVTWNLEERDGKWTKVPYNANTGARASSTGPATWSPLGVALSRYEAGACDGIGFVFAKDGPHCGVDLDKCRDPETGVIEPWAQAIIARLRTYCEVSPSGTGVKLFCRGKLPAGGRRKGRIEMYDSARFFTLTGHKLESAPESVNDCEAELAALHAETFAAEKPAKALPLNFGWIATYPCESELLHTIRQSKQAPLFDRLWSGDTSGHGRNDSNADLALCNILAFYLRDPDRIDRWFRASGLMRPKWDERRGEAGTYGALTIAKALEGRTEFYGDPPRPTEFTRDDIGNARRFVTLHGTVLRYCWPWQKWLVWDGKRWQIDNTGEVYRRAKQTIDDLCDKMKALPNDKRGELLKFITQSSKRERLNAMIALAASEAEIPVLPEQLDRDPWLLNCSNGTVDLRNGELRPHSPADLLTKLCPTPFDPNATAPEWEKFLDKVHKGNEGVIAFLQRYYGYGITGDVREQSLLILHGSGSNGKTTELETLRGVVGEDYSMQAVSDLLMERKGEAHLTERADLFGRRFVACSETEHNRAIRPALLKLLTGGESIRARRMREDTWEFRPTHKLILCTNHKPRVRGDDPAVWRRIYLVPFEARFWNPAKGETGAPEFRADKGLPERLAGEAPGILAWLIRGCVAWQRDGLKAPKDVLAATEQYRNSEDVVAEFIRECCQTDGENLSEGLPRLHEWYCDWAGKGGADALTRRQFSKELRRLGYVSYTNNGVWFRGLRCGSKIWTATEGGITE